MSSTYDWISKTGGGAESDNYSEEKDLCQDWVVDCFVLLPFGDVS